MDQAAFENSFEEFKKLYDGRLPLGEVVPVLDESETDVTYNEIYLLHVGWAARILAETKPKSHIDIGSCSYFVAIASAFLNLSAFDIRPMSIPLPNLVSGVADLTALPFSDDSVSSLSCMHAMEHVGLGRYKDKIDPDGDIKAARELKRVLATGGNLITVLPVGIPKLVFNAHRIYSRGHVLDMFSGLRLKEFSYIPMGKPQQLIKNAGSNIAENIEEGAGCFWFVKD